LKQLADSEEFLLATDGGVSDSRMDARECVLRYLAFHLKPYTAYGKSDLNGFLSGAMKDINSMSAGRLHRLGMAFREAMTRSHQVLGRFAFRKFTPDSYRRGPVNKALFESWANVLQAYDSEKLIENKQAICQEIAMAFTDDSEYTRALSAGTGSIGAVHNRFQRAHAILKRALA
jgi:hypothetical protein